MVIFAPHCADSALSTTLWMSMLLPQHSAFPVLTPSRGTQSSSGRVRDLLCVFGVLLFYCNLSRLPVPPKPNNSCNSSIVENYQSLAFSKFVSLQPLIFLSGTLITLILDLLILSHSPPKLCSFYFSIFSFFPLFKNRPFLLVWLQVPNFLSLDSLCLKLPLGCFSRFLSFCWDSPFLTRDEHLFLSHDQT